MTKSTATATLATATSTEYAANAGAELARQIMAQGGEPGEFERAGDLPTEDYVTMKRLFGEVTPEMEHAYKSGYNAAASE